VILYSCKRATIVWRLAPKASQTDRHQSSIAMSRSGPADTPTTSANRHAAPILGQRYARPLSFSASEGHVRVLDLTARKLSLHVEIKADQTEHNADRPAIVVRGLHGERIHHVLQDKSWAAHCVDVHLVVGGTHHIHTRDSLPKELSTFDQKAALPGRVAIFTLFPARE
jgi:hypothetical protein